MMVTKKIQVQSQFDDCVLDTLLCLPEGKEPCCVLEICHGMMEHKERYLDFASFLCENGIGALLYDLRGHGASGITGKPLGYFGAGKDIALVEDVQTVWKCAKLSCKRVLFGHSMGSLIVRELARKYDNELTALIVCGSPDENPLVGFGILLMKLLTLAQGETATNPLISKMVLGSFNRSVKNAKTPYDWLNADPKEVQKYQEDPLCGVPFTLNGYESLMRLMRNVYQKDGARAQHPDMPVLFLSGEEDPCKVSEAKFQSAMRAMADRGYIDVRGIEYAKQRHEILFSPDKDKVYRDILAFCEEAI